MKRKYTRLLYLTLFSSRGGFSFYFQFLFSLKTDCLYIVGFVGIERGTSTRIYRYGGSH
jgi:hypothetical protein